MNYKKKVYVPTKVRSGAFQYLSSYNQNKDYNLNTYYLKGGCYKK
ncbi:hypothetical protein E27107_140159 [Elizabethkingia anophelis]|nr:hypothetical protein E27107_140159 [Elizabethkingia anophelis]